MNPDDFRKGDATFLGDNSEREDQDSSEDEDQTPTHPIPSMQGPFEESIEDAAAPDASSQPGGQRKLGAKARRAKLLDTNQAVDTYNAKWRAAPEANFHPLTKILAQIAFGVHLLHQQLAKSDEEVVKILQRHVDDVDQFVAVTEEDIDLALADIKERINYLKLPLEHANVFDAMLDDKQFRTSIVEGNERIEQVVNRTANLMNDLHVDIKKALESTADMARYLESIAGDWPEDDAGSIEIYHTMQANAEGWLQCLGTLQMKGNSLGVAIAQLGRILNEMSKRAGVASRRSLAPRSAGSESNRSSTRNSSSRRSHRDDRLRSPAPLSRYSHRPMKALPEDPDMVARAVQATLPQKEQVPLEQRYNHPRESPSAPMTPRRGSSSRDYQKPRSGKATPRIKTTGQFGGFLRSTASSALPSPKLPPEAKPASRSGSRRESKAESKVVDKSQSKEVGKPPAKAEPKPESKPQSTLKRARSKLKRKSFGALGDKFKTQQREDRSQSHGSPSVADSAYSSGTDLDRRPNTDPGSIPRPPANFALFPSTPPLAPSIRSPRSISSNQDTDKESVVMALPPMPQKTMTGPSPLRRESEPAPTTTLKKKGSLNALKRWFKRQKGDKPDKLLTAPATVYELEG